MSEIVNQSLQKIAKGFVIENKYAEYIEQLNEVNIFSDIKKLEKLTVMELTDLSQKCQRYKSYLGEWITTISSQTTRIETESQKIKKWITIWQKTNESAKEQNLPRDVINTIRSVIQLLQKADQNIATQIKKLNSRCLLCNAIIIIVAKKQRS